MPKSYPTKGAIAPDVDIYTTPISSAFKEHYVSVTLYQDNYSNPVNPSSGTCLLLGTDDGFNFGTIQNGIIDLTDPAYARPVVYGTLFKLKARFTDIVGANLYNITVTSKD